MNFFASHRELCSDTVLSKADFESLLMTGKARMAGLKFRSIDGNFPFNTAQKLTIDGSIRAEERFSNFFLFRSPLKSKVIDFFFSFSARMLKTMWLMPDIVCHCDRNRKLVIKSTSFFSSVCRVSPYTFWAELSDNSRVSYIWSAFMQGVNHFRWCSLPHTTLLRINNFNGSFACCRVLIGSVFSHLSPFCFVCCF